MILIQGKDDSTVEIKQDSRVLFRLHCPVTHQVTVEVLWGGFPDDVERGARVVVFHGAGGEPVWGYQVSQLSEGIDIPEPMVVGAPDGRPSRCFVDAPAEAHVTHSVQARMAIDPALFGSYVNDARQCREIERGLRYFAPVGTNAEGLVAGLRKSYDKAIQRADRWSGHAARLGLEIRKLQKAVNRRNNRVFVLRERVREVLRERDAFEIECQNWRDAAIRDDADRIARGVAAEDAAANTAECAAIAEDEADSERTAEPVSGLTPGGVCRERG